MTKIGVIDCGISNIASVLNAFAHLGIAAESTREAKALGGYSHLVLPGVGSFPAGMAALRGSGLDNAIRKRAAAGTPVIGLCLGMQLLAEEGEEFGQTRGLGLIPGKIGRLTPDDAALRLPHIGWNLVAFRQQNALTEGLGDEATFYFVHGYGYADTDAGEVAGTCEYGGDIVALVARDNVFGAQFHPEKSQRAGLKLLENFAALC